MTGYKNTRILIIQRLFVYDVTFVYLLKDSYNLYYQVYSNYPLFIDLLNLLRVTFK